MLIIELTMQLAGRYFVFQAACHVCKLGRAYGLIIRQTYWQPLQSTVSTDTPLLQLMLQPCRATLHVS